MEINRKQSYTASLLSQNAAISLTHNASLPLLNQTRIFALLSLNNAKIQVNADIAVSFSLEGFVRTCAWPSALVVQIPVCDNSGLSVLLLFNDHGRSLIAVSVLDVE